MQVALRHMPLFAMLLLAAPSAVQGQSEPPPNPGPPPGAPPAPQPADSPPPAEVPAPAEAPAAPEPAPPPPAPPAGAPIMAPPTPPSVTQRDDYPRCSKTVTDNCVQDAAPGKRRR